MSKAHISECKSDDRTGRQLKRCLLLTLYGSFDNTFESRNFMVSRFLILTRNKVLSGTHFLAIKWTLRSYFRLRKPGSNKHAFNFEELLWSKSVCYFIHPSGNHGRVGRWERLMALHWSEMNKSRSIATQCACVYLFEPGISNVCSSLTIWTPSKSRSMFTEFHVACGIFVKHQFAINVRCAQQTLKRTKFNQLSYRGDSSIEYDMFESVWCRESNPRPVEAASRWDTIKLYTNWKTKLKNTCIPPLQPEWYWWASTKLINRVIQNMGKYKL